MPKASKRKPLKPLCGCEALIEVVIAHPKPEYSLCLLECTVCKATWMFTEWSIADIAEAFSSTHPDDALNEFAPL